MAKKILITGATGFVGSRLASRLANKNYEIHCLIRETSNLWRINHLKGIILHKADLTSAEETRKILKKINPDFIYHFACYGGFAGENKAAEIFNTNTLITFNLLQACTESKLTKFIAIGSSSEYGNKTDPMNENMAERPISLYGVTKLAATHLVRQFGEASLVPAIILRIFSPYGTYDDSRRLIPTAINACIKKTELALGSGSPVRDYLYVEDVIDACILGAESKINQGEIFNIGSGQQHSVKTIVDKILELFNHPIQPQWASKQDRINEPSSWCADISKAMHVLNWKPVTSLTEGLEQTINWSKQRAI